MNKTNKNKDYDIMIAGGGPAGVSTWLYLNKYAPDLASRSVVIEKEKHPREKLCGGALLNPFVNKMFKDVNISLTTQKVDVDAVNIKYKENSFSFKRKLFLSIIHRPEFDNFLVDIARRRGAKILEKEAFIDLENKKNDLSVKTSSKHHSVKILVGADGALSKVRKSIPSPYRISYAATLETFAPVNPKYDTEFENKTALLDWSCFNEGIQGYIWHFPCIINDQPYMSHGICDSRINPDFSTGNIKKVFKKEIKKRKIDIPQSACRSHPVPYFSERKKLSDNHVLLVGDAAGIEPLIGGGIHLSLLYGDVAARSIISAFKNNDFSLKEYTEKVNKNVVGKYINNSVTMAKKVYSMKADVLETIKGNLNVTAKFGDKD